MEDTSWRSILFAAGASILLLFITYFLVTSKTMDFLNVGPPEHIIEFENAHVIGRQGDKKDWEVIAATGWSTKNQDETNLSGIQNGWVYEDNIPIIKNISAESVKIYKRTDIVEAIGNPLKADVDLLRVSSSKKKRIKYSKLSAQRISYNGKQKISQVFKDIKIVDGRTVILSDHMEIDHNKKLATLTANPRVLQGKTSIFCREIVANPETEEYLAQGNPRLNLKEKNKTTKITSDKIFVKKGDRETIDLIGSIKIIQPKKIAVSDQAHYDEDNTELTLKGKVRTVFEKGEEFLTEKTINNISNPEAQELLKEKTVLVCDDMTIYTDSDDALATGNVYITQKGKEAKSDRALYKDDEEKIYMTGQVTLKKKDKWVDAEEVVVSIQDESFEAQGRVETKFILKKKH